MKFFSTFRGRLSLILAFLLVATLGVQYYLNLLSQQENIELRDAQSQALVAGIAIGSNALTAPEDRVTDLVNRPGQTFLDAESRSRIEDIIIINNNWEITDSINPDHWPTALPNGELSYRPLSDVKDLPPLMEGGRLGDDLANFPNQKEDAEKLRDNEAHAVPIDTSEGRWYIMVILKNNRTEAMRRAAQPLLFTLIVWLISTAMTLFLVWRFTRPIANLSDAARKVAEGDLSVRVPDAEKSTDEMGRLSQRFNEMIAELEKSRELEAQLQQAEKSAVIGRLGSAIAHEIRNPLNYINLTLDHLRSKYPPADPEDRKLFEKLTSQLKGEVARINGQITDFLNYSRPKKAHLKPINAREVIDNSLRIVEAQAEETAIKISVIEQEESPELLGDVEMLRSVFNNLFINAVQSMEATGGSLIVRIARDGEMVRIAVEDTGNGIHEENLQTIFEPYFSTKETGTGLGLAIVQKIVETHNGTVEAESTVGKGTIFTVRLPVANG